MDVRGFIIGIIWIVIGAISVTTMWIGGVNTWTYLFVGILIFLSLIFTIVLGFGLGLREFHGPESPKKTARKLEEEIKTMRGEIKDIKQVVDEIRKTLEE